MDTIRAVIAAALISLGLLLLVVSTIGLLRLPNFYSRAHAVAMAEILGLALVFAGALFLPDSDPATAVKLVLVMGFSMLANPTAVHALADAAHRAGIPPWRPEQTQPKPADSASGSKN